MQDAARAVSELVDGDTTSSPSCATCRSRTCSAAQPVRLDPAEIGAYVRATAGVLVTGAGGSIGSELCRQLVPHGGRSAGADRPRREQPLHDRARARRARRRRTSIPVHRRREGRGTACAPLLESTPRGRLPRRGLQARAADGAEPDGGAAQQRARHARPGARGGAAGVERFVLVSTDKAVNPQTVDGRSKALAEWVVEAAAQAESDTRSWRCASATCWRRPARWCRSSASRSRAAARSRSPTSEMTRYFMTIPEAAQLIVAGRRRRAQAATSSCSTWASRCDHRPRAAT